MNTELDLLPNADEEAARWMRWQANRLTPFISEGERSRKSRGNSSRFTGELADE